MAFSIRLTEEERKLADSYAKTPLHDGWGKHLNGPCSTALTKNMTVPCMKKHITNTSKTVKKPSYCRFMEGDRALTYAVETTSRFDKEFKKLDKYTQRMLKAWIVKFGRLRKSTNTRKKSDGQS